MSMHIIYNRLGTGKTLLMTFFGAVTHAKRRDIYSNYEIGIPHKPVNSLDDLNDMRNGMFLWDDAYVWANSRRIKETKSINMIFAKSRKRGIDIIWSTTRPSQVDINIRYNTAYAWIPQIILDKTTRIPIELIARKYEFIPEGANDTEILGRLLNVIRIRGEVLKYVMEIYDTTEEIEEFAQPN